MATTKNTPPGKKNRANKMLGTQTHLRFSEIRDDVLVLKSGGIRAILKTTSINFNLKSEQEQKSIIFGYQGFLNSLEFPIQILIRSKKLDIDDYIDQVRELGDKQQNPLLQEQTYEYAEYVRKLVEYADIMEKNFYVVVPYDPGRSQGAGFFQGFFQKLAPKDSYLEIKGRHAEFNHLKKGLAQRINVVKSGLENCGLKVEELNTQQLIELFYNTFNPKISRSAKLKDLQGITVETDEEKIENEKKDEKEEEDSI